jgi:plasmid stabilization system protein ParE
MSAKSILVPEAEQDIADAYDWYEARRPGLGEDFLSCVDACIQAICRNPEMCAVVHQAYRRALLRRFPYAVFYEHTGDLVTVYSVFHTSQDPAKWRQRLP